jgi:hypothetical protein
MIRKWKPWEKSTGPKTESGKATAAKNSDKGGEWRKQRELFKMMNELLREQREAMQELTVPGITALLDTEKTDL